MRENEFEMLFNNLFQIFFSIFCMKFKLMLVADSNVKINVKILSITQTR